MMFCQNCGTKVIDGARFCQKCGAEIASTNTAGQITYGSAPIPRMINTPNNQNNDFKEFVDNHVRKVTGLQSAEELLNSKVPQAFKFLWICCGIIAIFLFICFIHLPSLEMLFSLILVYIFLFLFFVFPIALLVDYIRSYRVTGGVHKTSGSINADELILFLNRNLSYLSPYFNEWDYIRMAGFGVRGLAVASVQNALLGTRVGTEFGHKKSCFINIHISPDRSNPDSGQTAYFFSTAARLSIWPARYTCMIKSAPILHAAMEYYIMEKNNQTHVG